jgi:hypothetical protein
MKQKLLSLTILLFTITLQSQVKEEEKKESSDSQSRIKVYTPSGEATKASKKDNSYKWALKTDIFGIISGEFPIVGEYRIAPKFSVEVSAGVTYAYIPNNLFSTDEKNGGSFENTKAAMGTAFRGTIKYYPSSDYDAIEGWNFGIQLFSKTTNRDYESSNSNPSNQLLTGNKDTKTKTGVSLIIGKQIFADSNVTFESYIGIGFANVKRQFSVIDSNYNNTTSQTEYTISNPTTDETTPNFQLGFRIGFGN